LQFPLQVACPKTFGYTLVCIYVCMYVCMYGKRLLRHLLAILFNDPVSTA